MSAAPGSPELPGFREDQAEVEIQREAEDFSVTTDTAKSAKGNLTPQTRRETGKHTEQNHDQFDIAGRQRSGRGFDWKSRSFAAEHRELKFLVRGSNTNFDFKVLFRRKAWAIR